MSITILIIRIQIRGATAPVDELQYIYNHSDSKAALIMDIGLLKRLEEAGWLESKHGRPSLVIVLRAEKEDLAHLDIGTPIVSLEDILAIGATRINEYRPPSVNTDDLHTLCYTSGDRPLDNTSCSILWS